MAQSVIYAVGTLHAIHNLLLTICRTSPQADIPATT